MEIDESSQAEALREVIRNALDETIDSRHFNIPISESTRHHITQLAFNAYRIGFNAGIDASISTMKSVKQSMR